MTDSRFHNDDFRYEMLLALLPQENENLPDAESIMADLRDVVRLCYAYTASGVFRAEDLAKAICDQLFTSWGLDRAKGMAEWTKSYFEPQPATSDGADDA